MAGIKNTVTTERLGEICDLIGDLAHELDGYEYRNDLGFRESLGDILFTLHFKTAIAYRWALKTPRVDDCAVEPAADGR